MIPFQKLDAWILEVSDKFAEVTQFFNSEYYEEFAEWEESTWNLLEPFIEEVPKSVVIEDIYLQDIVPTSLDLANIEVSSNIDFNSFKEILFDESSDQINNGIYGTYGCCPGNYFNFQRIIRKDGFKLMFFPKNKRIELYNVEDDPFELNNLAGDENYFEKILSLGNDFVELQKNYNDTLNIKKIFKNIWKDSKS